MTGIEKHWAEVAVEELNAAAEAEVRRRNWRCPNCGRPHPQYEYAPFSNHMASALAQSLQGGIYGGGADPFGMANMFR